MKLRKWLSVLLALCMALSLTPVEAVLAGDADGTVPAERGQEMTWAELQAAFRAGGDVTLGCDVLAEEDDTALKVPSGTAVTLDLNGHTIDRRLSSAMPGGSVITVNGELTVNDSEGGGTITGGYTTGYGGGIQVGGTLTLNGGAITGNRAEGANNKSGGGGVALSSGAEFNMCGGAITGNATGSANGNQGGGVYIGSGYFYLSGGAISGNTSSGQGAGVYVLTTSHFTVYGSTASVTGNTRNGAANNVYFAGKAFLFVGDGDAGSGVIGVSSKASNGVILYLDDPGLLSGFVSDSDDYVLALTESGEYEAQLVPRTFLVTVDGGITGGTVTSDKRAARAGETVTLTVAPGQDMALKTLTVTDANGDPVTVSNNSFAMPHSDVTVSATFESTMSYWVDVDNEIEHGSIQYPYDRIRAGETVTITAQPDYGRVTASLTVLMDDGNNMFTYTHEVPGVTHPDPNTIAFPMPSANVMVFASFSEYGKNRVFICDMEGGTVAADRNLAADGDTVTLTVRPDNGYTYDPESLSVKRVDLYGYESELTLTELTPDSVYSFTMGYDSAYVSASFTKAPEQPKYAVTIETDEMENGTLTADHSEASEGWTVRLTAEPDTLRGYALESLTVVDRAGNEYPTTPVGNNQYTFTMPACEVFASAVFSIPSYPITLVTEDNGTGCEVLADSEAEYGWPVSVVCILRPDTSVKSLTFTGSSTGSSASIPLSSHSSGSLVYFYTFPMPNEPVTINAVFERTPYTVSADPSVPGTFTVSVNGTAYALPQDFHADDELTISYTPTEGQLLKTLQYSYIRPDGSTVSSRLPFRANADGTFTASVTMPGADVILSVEEERAWKALQTQLSSAQNGGTILLTADAVAAAEDAALTVPAGKTVTLDLNGHTIDRHLTAAAANGNVITNNGTLTVTDSSAAQTGTITGGNNSGSGGAIVNHGTVTISGGTVSGNTATSNGGGVWTEGTLTLNGGSISDNTAQNSGGAIYINAGTVTISGGTISGNTAAGYHGGAIYVIGNTTTLNLSGGTITGNTAGMQGGAILKYQDRNTVNIQGSPVITNNTAANGSNIYLRNGTQPLHVTGALGADARIGVTLAAGAGTVTNGFGASGNGLDQLACFSADAPAYMAGVSSSREVFLGEPVTVSFDPGQGTGAMEPVQVAKGGGYALPESGFTPPQHQTFHSWSVDGEDGHAPGSEITVSGNTTLTAVWENLYTVTIEADEGCTVTVLAVDSESEYGGTPIASGDTVPAGTVLAVSAGAKPGCRLTVIPEAAYTVTEDLTITAASEALTYTVTATATEGGAQPTVSAENPIPHGTEVTVTATAAESGYEFTGWYQQGSSKQLTAEQTYTFIAAADLALEARYQRAAGIVTFIKDNIVQKTITASGITQEDFPADPLPLYGFQFDGWDKTVEEINAALVNGENVTVSAKFIQLQASIVVTVYNGETETPTTLEYTESQWIPLTAEAVEGKTFAYWTLDGAILSYNENATFRTETSCTVRAVYAAEAVEAVGTALIRTGTYNADTKKLSFVAYLTVPQGAKIAASGLVAASGAGSYDPAAELTMDNADYVKNSAKAVGTGGPVTYTWTKTAVSIGDVWYARPYVRYTYNGETCTVYGDRVKVTAGCDYDFSEKATATIRSTVYYASTRKALFVASLTVPEGGVISKSGLVAAPGSFDAANTLLTWETATYKKNSDKAIGTGGPVSYTWAKTAVDPGDTWYVRPYVMYTDAAGKEHTVYGELLTYTAG